MESKKINEMFAFVSIDSKYSGDEGVMGIFTNGKWVPLIGADMDRVVSLLPYADIISKKTNIPYRILKFSKREDITEMVKIGE